MFRFALDIMLVQRLSVIVIFLILLYSLYQKISEYCPKCLSTMCYISENPDTRFIGIIKQYVAFT
jgi:hypothetical protein